MPLSLCQHRWMTLKTSYLDRFNWISIERCRKCSKLEQATWVISQIGGKMGTTCLREEVAISNKHGEIDNNTETP